MQLEVFPNPLVRARRVYPYVVVLQADIAAAGRDRVIAFMVARKQIGQLGGKLMPVVEVGGHEFVVLMPSITNVPVAELRRPVGDLAAYRSKIVDALDWMFLGI
jgi:mRNA-degrading endonuclease toxin of MazEF toxin-antitoxin module